METIVHADNVVFVEGGAILEAESRLELIRKGGRVADYRHQRRAAMQWRL